MIWRESEGQPKDQPRPSTQASDIWRSSSATETATPSKEPKERVDIWKKPPGDTTGVDGETKTESDSPTKTREKRRRRSERSEGAWRKESRRSRDKKVRRWPYVAALVIVLALGADAIFVAAGLSSTLLDSRARAEEAISELRDGDPAAAGKTFGGIANDAENAEDYTLHPAFRLARVIPGVSDEVIAVEKLSKAVVLGGQAGVGVSGVAEELGVDENGFAASLYSEGVVDLDRLRSVQPRLAEASGLLGQATEELQSTQSPSYSVVRDAFDTASDRINEAYVSSRTGTAAFSLLPGLLGGDEPRRYLLIFQALGEARGTGGLAGLYGVLAVDNGALRLEHVGPYSDLGPDPIGTADAPKWFERNYGPQSALKQWQQANLSPNFPVSAGVFLQMYENATGEVLDGVFGMDPVTLESMLGSESLTVGSQVVPGPDVAEFLLADSYEVASTRSAHDRLLEGVVSDFWEKVSSGDLDSIGFVEGIGGSVSDGHLKVMSNDGEEQALLAELGVAGDPAATSTTSQLIFNNNYSINKVDYFLQRSTRTRVNLNVFGEAQVKTRVTLNNRAPAGPPSLLLGPGRAEDPPGFNRMILGFLLPKSAEVHAFKVSRQPDPAFPFLYRDSGRPVTWDLIEIPAGGSRQVDVEYFFGAEERFNESGGTFSMTLQPQTAVNPEEFELVLSPPQGYVLEDESGLDPTLDGSNLVYSGLLEQPLTVTVSARPAGL